MRSELFVVSLFIPTLLAQIPISRCPSVKVQQNFDVAAYLGKWYEQEKYPLIFEIGGKCITADYSKRSDGKVEVFNQMKNVLTNSVSSIKGTAELASEKGEAKLSVTFKTPVTVTSPYWVLSTDYVNCSVVYSCQTIFGISARMYLSTYYVDINSFRFHTNFSKKKRYCLVYLIILFYFF
ncbi:unnamed protein product [Diabrotica balteata]|uniref:Apolipoprotein D n=1 Tax=Diabrotica balteata TaxID=107213 RepID=A0A9N9TB91_DIABA|nr:unnamed protein product [Diabrotica balteata]